MRGKALLIGNSDRIRLPYNSFHASEKTCSTYSFLDRDSPGKIPELDVEVGHSLDVLLMQDNAIDLNEGFSYSLTRRKGSSH